MFAVSANNVDVRPFFDALVEDTPYSVAVHPAVSGQISLTLKEVVLEDVFGRESNSGYAFSTKDGIYPG